MATAVIMPKQGQSVETCIITKWFRNKGDKVSVGDILFSYETDKASFDIESPVDGVLLEIFFGDGAEVPVLVNVAVIGKTGETTDSFNPSVLPQKASTVFKTFTAIETLETAETLESVKTSEGQNDNNNKIRISPRAKRLAEKKGIKYKHFRDRDQMEEL
jgi:pyruvate dehydrogenase E2 component (dihydrolipoamide acetyltransferase)